MGQLAGDRMSSTSSTYTSRERALELARELEEMLTTLAADAGGPEHFDLRLAGALAGNLADHLEAITEHGLHSRRLQKGTA